MIDRDPYMILNVSPYATEAQIHSAYRKLARIYHPDLNERSDADARMQEINWAYDVLSDPVKRADYDRAHPQVSRSVERQRYGSLAWRVRDDRGRAQPRAGDAGLRPWPPQSRPAAPRGMPYGMDRLAAGAVAATLILVAFVLIDSSAAAWGPLTALPIGVAIAAMPDRKTSAQNGAAVGAIVSFLFTVAAWTRSAGAIGGDVLLGQFVCSGATAMLLGVPVGAMLGRVAAAVKR